MRLVTHLAVGLLLSGLIYLMGLPIDVSVFCLVGSLLPKVDNLPLFYSLKRKVFHNVWFLLLAAMAIAWPGTTIMAISFAVGTLSHYLLDFFSKEGVYPLWPQELVHVELRLIENENVITTFSLSLLASLAIVRHLNDMFLALMAFVVVSVVMNKNVWK